MPKIIKLSDIAMVISGQSPESIYYSNTNGTPFLQGNRTFGGKYPTIDTYTNKITKIAPKNSILMSVRAPVGDLNIAPFDICIGRGLASISSKDNENESLYYILKYNIKNLLGRGNGTTFDSVNRDAILDFDLIVPKLDFANITKILQFIDKKIELNNKINQELENIAKTLYNYWFVQFDFPDKNGRPYKSSGGAMVYNEVLKREIPIDWKVKELQNYCNIFTGKKDVKMANATGLYKFFSCAPEPLKSNEFICDAEAILVAGNGSYTGRVTYYNGKFDLYQRTYACIQKDNADKIMPFLYFFMKFFFEPQFKGGTHGSAIPYIVFGDLANLGIPFDNNTILKYSEIIDPILKKIFLNNENNQELSALRDFLLPMLMNGQIKISS